MDHGLLARCEVDNAEAPMQQDGFAILPAAVLVRPTVVDQRRHAPEYGPDRIEALTRQVECARKSTHAAVVAPQ